MTTPTGVHTAKGVGCLLLAIAGLLALIFLNAAIVVVPAGFRGVIFSSVTGTKEASLGEGMHIITPVVDTPHLFEVRTRTYTFSDAKGAGGDHVERAISAKTADAQAVFLDITVRYHAAPDSVPDLYRTVGEEYEATIVKPNTGGTVREVVAAYTAEDVYSTKRQEIETTIAQRLATEFTPRFIALDEFLIRNVSFTPEYHRAIEQKQIALQRAQKKKYELDRERQEKERKTIEAKGQGDAINVRGYALAKYPAVVQYEYVDSLPKTVPTYITSGDTIVSLSDLLAKGKQQGQ